MSQNVQFFKIPHPGIDALKLPQVNIFKREVKNLILGKGTIQSI